MGDFGVPGEARGEALGRIFERKMSVEKQVAIIFAASKGYIDSVPAEKVAEFESSLFDYLEANNSKDLKAIVAEGSISDELAATLEKAISSFTEGFDS